MVTYALQINASIDAFLAVCSLLVCPFSQAKIMSRANNAKTKRAIYATFKDVLNR